MPKPFTKGDPRINRQGRRPGVANRSSDELRQLVQTFIENNIDDIQANFDKLEPMAKLNFLEKLLRHCLPSPMPEVLRLSEDDFDTMIQKLREQANTSPLKIVK